MRLMFGFHRCLALTLVALAVLAFAASAQDRERAGIPENYKADVAALYPSDAAWREAKDALAREVPSIAQFQGKLLSSGKTLADALDLMSALGKELSRLSSYANITSDVDTRDSSREAMRQEIIQLGTTLRTQSAFLDPEILSAVGEAIDRLISSEPRLNIYKVLLTNIRRRADHTLPESEERLLAGLRPLAGAPSNIHNVLANADFPYPTVALSDGRHIRIDQTAYNDLRASPLQEDRKTVMSAFFSSLGGFKRTFGALMNGEVQKTLFYAKARRYPSALEMSLDGPNIPVSVYSRLVEGVNRNLPAPHRYLALRKRMLGVSELHYYDLYAPLVPSVKLEYTPEEAQQHVIAAMKPLGAEYEAALRKAFNDRWIDLMPSTGKRPGAYANGSAYDVHPYVVMNFNGKYNDVSTLAHELGHALHSHFSNKTQPYPLAGYPIFVAEVASTFNESLLIDYMLKNITDDDARLSLLGNYLENIKGTVFRQVQFAEFELRMHELAQQGQPIVGDTLANLYMEITKKYYGHDRGICIVDDYVANEWSFVPHFYSSFYVFQYATSFAASEALAEKVKSGDAAATARYLAFLNAGGSRYPMDLLREAGVDMTTDEPLDLTVKAMNRVMDEMERILARRDSRGD